MAPPLVPRSAATQTTLGAVRAAGRATALRVGRLARCALKGAAWGAIMAGTAWHLLLKAFMIASCTPAKALQDQVAMMTFKRIVQGSLALGSFTIGGTSEVLETS